MRRDRHSICCGIVRHVAMRRRDAMSARPASPIPLFGRKPVNPFVPIGISQAIARSVGQGRPQAGARALPLTEASTVARSRPVGGGARARGLIITAIVLAMTYGSISAVSAASVKTQSAPTAAINPVNPYAGHIAEASRRFGIPESWIRAVMRVESRGQVKAVSPKGAIGLMQIMPDTWAGLRLRYRLGRNPQDPHDNILAGAAYLREMHDRYGAAGFLAAYNAGPGRYQDYVATGRPLPAETRAYVAALAPLIGGDPVSRAVVIAAGVTAWIRAPLFAVVADSTSSAHRPRSDGRLHARSIADLSGLEPPHDWHSRDMLRGASLFFARTSSGPPH
jgi:soluble lytic murein transglycosylase-like protein